MRKLLIQFIFSLSFILSFNSFAQQNNDARFKYNSSQFRTYGRGTLFEEIKRNADTVELGVYSSKVVSGVGRQMISQIEVAISEWDSDSFQLPDNVQVNEDGQIFIKHRIKDEFFPIFSLAGDPVCRAESATSSSSTAEEWIEEISQAVEQQEEISESGDTALQKKQIIYEQMIEDYGWFENKRSELIRKLGGPAFLGQVESADSNAQQSLAISVLEAFAKSETFIKDPERAERIFVALTLYGEFGTVDSYRSLPNLYWAHQSIKNRERFSAWKNQEIKPQFDPKNIAQEAFGGTRLSVVLVDSQYSTWNLGDRQLSTILMNKMGPITREIMDFIAADDAGLIQTEGSSSVITHYVSPVGLSSDSSFTKQNEKKRDRLSSKAFEEMLLDRNYPSWWFSSEFKVYSSDEYPKLIRLDQDDGSSLDSKINPRHFAGARENR